MGIKRITPCPCMSLQKGCMVIAMVDAVFNMIQLGIMILTLIGYLAWNDQNLTKSERDIGITSVTLQSILCLLRIAFAFKLYNGARSKRYKDCRFWFIVTTVLTLINFIVFIVNVTIGEYENDIALIAAIIGILYNIYTLVVAGFYLRELRIEKALGIGPEFSATATPQIVEARSELPPYPYHHNSNSSFSSGEISFTSESNNAYPMQDYGNRNGPTTTNQMPDYGNLNSPTTTNQHYPAPVHHVTPRRMSNSRYENL